MSLRLTKTRSDLRQPRFQSSRAFTLVELLVAMAIISILGALLVGVAAVATETARRARSEQMVSRLHTLLVDYYEGFRNQRVELNESRNNSGVAIGAGAVIDDVLSPIRNGNGYQNWQRLRGQLLAAARLGALRERMITEIPERWTDIYLNTIPDDVSTLRVDNAGQPMFSAGRSGLASLMLRKLARTASSINTLTGDPNTLEELLANEHAECLYLVITLATGDGEARGLFSESDIGDVDGDGAPEFLDGWGRPIQFLRWAPGINTSSQLNQIGLRQLRLELENRGLPQDEIDKRITETINENFDPFDPFRSQTDIDLTNERTWTMLLLPYIWSEGPDEESGVLTDPLGDGERNSGFYVTWRPSSARRQLITSKPYFQSLPNPYQALDIRNQGGNDNQLNQIGMILDPELAADNISNHTTATN